MARTSLKNIIQILEESENVNTPENNFLRDLKRSIELHDVATSRAPSQTYKPSSMQCIRNMFYQRSGVSTDKPDPSYILVGICNSGSDIHERTQMAVSRMNDYGMDCEYVDVATYIKKHRIKDVSVVAKSGMETKLFHEKYHMSFMCDGIIKYAGKYYILEIKTETQNKWYSRSEVDPKHYDQATAYSTALGINHVIFLYINRDNLDMKSFMFDVTDDMKMNLVGKITECDTYIDKGIAPPKPANADTKLCQYCNYKESCRRDG